jgi:hypothetical protein
MQNQPLLALGGKPPSDQVSESAPCGAEIVVVRSGEAYTPIYPLVMPSPEVVSEPPPHTLQQQHTSTYLTPVEFRRKTYPLGWGAFSEESNSTRFAAICEFMFGPCTHQAYLFARDHTRDGLMDLAGLETLEKFFYYLDGMSADWEDRTADFLIKDLCKLFSSPILNYTAVNIYFDILRICWVLTPERDEVTWTVLYTNFMRLYSRLTDEGLPYGVKISNGRLFRRYICGYPFDPFHEGLLETARTNSHIWEILLESFTTIRKEKKNPGLRMMLM